MIGSIMRHKNILQKDLFYHNLKSSKSFCSGHEKRRGTGGTSRRKTVAILITLTNLIRSHIRRLTASSVLLPQRIMGVVFFSCYYFRAGSSSEQARFFEKQLNVRCQKADLEKCHLQAGGQHSFTTSFNKYKVKSQYTG